MHVIRPVRDYHHKPNFCISQVTEHKFSIPYLMKIEVIQKAMEMKHKLYSLLVVENTMQGLKIEKIMRLQFSK